MQRKSSSHVSNRQIVHELREGNRVGYKHLSERFHRGLLHEAVSVYRIDRADAEEIVNDVLLLVASRILGFEFKRSDNDFRSWIVTILRNRIRDHLRKTSPTQYLKSSIDDEVIPDYSFLRDHDSEATVSILRGLKGQDQEAEIPRAGHRDLLNLREVLESMHLWEQVLLRCRALEIPYEEIALYTGKSARVLKVYHSRVQRKLRKEMVIIYLTTPLFMLTLYQSNNSRYTVQMKQIRFKSLADFHKVFPDEKACHRFLALMRWNENPVCVHCGSDRKVYWLKAANRLRCADCKKDFSVRIGTIFEDSALPLLKWFIAMWLITSHKKGIASTQLAKDVGVTQKTAWFMNHRIRHAMASEDFRKPLDGIVEVDETYIGGLEGNKHESKKGRKGRGSVGKTPVLGMLDRDDGIVKTQVMNRVTSNTVHRTMTQHISDKSTIMTDESSVYRKTLLSFDGHDQVNHVQGEYVRDDVHTNTIDGFWSIMKRGIIGIYHQISEKHTHRYCEEFEYRYNTRKEHDSDRFRQVAQKLNGRLTYKTLIS